jgi:hypothetical protein
MVATDLALPDCGQSTLGQASINGSRIPQPILKNAREQMPTRMDAPKSIQSAAKSALLARMSSYIISNDA